MRKTNEGFTVGELLVTVAIIGVLTSVSIPLFSWVIENNKETTDSNYLKTARISYMAEYEADATIGDTVQYYNAETGEITALRSECTAYGQGTSAGADTEDHTNKLIELWIDDGAVEADWTGASLDGNEASNGVNPLLYTYSNLGSNFSKTVTTYTKINNVITYSLNSGDTTNTNAQALSAQIAAVFPNTNISAWRITNESVYTVTVTDVDISKLSEGTIVKAIRYNPNGKVNGVKVGTYTAAWVQVITIGTGSSAYNALDIESTLTKGYWEELGAGTSSAQTSATKVSYASTVDIYNSYPDIKS